MIKVGEYVRTPEEGYIGKLVERIKDALNYYKIDVSREIIHCDNLRDNYIYSREGFGLKHSKNIIDLIEEGDYVNGEKVVGRGNNCILILTDEGQTFLRSIFEDNDIKSIVTKEMMKSIEYRVE